MGSPQLHRATSVHLPDETAQSPKDKIKGVKPTLAAHGQDERNNRTQRQSRGQRPHDQRRHYQPCTESEVIRPAR